MNMGSERLSRPIRLGIVAGALRAGGTERYLAVLLAHLDRSIIEPEVILVTGYDLDAERAGHELGCRAQVIRYGGDHNRFLASARLVGHLARARPDAVYCLQGILTILGPLAARIARVPVVLTAQRNMGHGFANLASRRRLQAWITRRLVDAVLVNADAIRQRMIERGEATVGAVHVIPNPLEVEPIRCAEPLAPESIHPAARSLPLITQVGRLAPVKNQDCTLRAVSRLRRAGRDFVLAFAGRGPDEERLRRRAGELGLANRVVFLGDRTDVLSVIKTSTVTALPSVEEGSPNAILESLVAGVPVVATRVGGIPEILRAPEWLVAPDDDEALARALMAVLADPESARRRARELGASTALRHEPGVVARLHEDLIRRIVSGSRAGRARSRRGGASPRPSPQR